MWAQYDFGDGPAVAGAATVLFCLWLAWSRFRVVLPLLDKTQAVGLGGGRRGAAPGRRGAGLPADRQREDGHGRARRRDPGAEPRERWSSAGITG